MGISYSIPQTADYIPTSNTFTAQFNIPDLGAYGFQDTAAAVSARGANQGQRVLRLERNTTYYIDRVSIGGNISEGNYLDAIEVLPTVVLKREVDRQIIHKLPFPVNNYIDDKDMATFIDSQKNKGDDWLTIDFYGTLRQTPALVGVLQVKIFVNYTIFAILGTEYYSKFRSPMSGKAGEQIRG